MCECSFRGFTLQNDVVCETQLLSYLNIRGSRGSEPLLHNTDTENLFLKNKDAGQDKEMKAFNPLSLNIINH